jgi:putative phenazine biosynthesis phzC/phzF protein
MASVSELRFLNEMKKMDDQIAEMSHKRQVQNMITWGVVGISIIVLLLLFIVWKKNTTLKKTNKSLYQKNVSMLQREEEERQRWKVYEHQLEELKSIANVSTQSKPEEKYKASQLSEVDMDELANNILAVMETSEEIFSFDFSRERLAEIVMSKPKYVSQVINERFRCNFNVFINDYRIKEACRRINDFKKYGSMTIEAIANSVGFKSRTSFVNSFKMFTGLMPSEYLRLAKESKM